MLPLVPQLLIINDHNRQSSLATVHRLTRLSQEKRPLNGCGSSSSSSSSYWRKALRRVCNLPPTCHTEIVNLLNKNVPLFDDICKRSLKFIQSYMTSDNRVVNFITRRGVF